MNRFISKMLFIAFAAFSASVAAQHDAGIGAKHAQITKTADGGTALRLIGTPTIQIGKNVLSLNDGATYYPDKKLVEASFVKSITPLSENSYTLSCNGNRVRAVFSDGTVVQADQMCLAGTSYTCKNGEMSQEADSPACPQE